MQADELKSLLQIAVQAAQEAGQQIMEVYNSADFSVEAKSDQSPITLADRKAHECIMGYLAKTPYPVLSEEGKAIDYQTRSQWEYFWMVDPLDGTKEFIKKNGEFTVNIALIHQGKSMLGVVYPPVLEKMYSAIQGQGAYLETEGAKQKLSVTASPKEDEDYKIVASRSHLNDETKAFMEQYPRHEIVSMGSSLKFMLVAEGKAHVYPRLAPTMEWDTAAAQIVVEEAGGAVINHETKSQLNYNKENLRNPYFVVYHQKP